MLEEEVAREVQENVEVADSEVPPALFRQQTNGSLPSRCGLRDRHCPLSGGSPTEEGQVVHSGQASYGSQQEYVASQERVPAAG